jgi:cyclopropane fatty-acyl-phospholipid synthase-like methyltransferase
MVKYTDQKDYWVDPKTGRFRDEFDQMYRDYDDPWGCSVEAGSLNNTFLCSLISYYQCDSLLEIGSGTGTLLNFISAQSKQMNCKSYVGLDISEEACKRATARYPLLNFDTRDIRCEDFRMDEPYGMIVMAEVLWYVCEKFENVIRNVKATLAKDGIYIIKQFFPKKQQYGAMYINGYDDFYTNLNQLGFIIDKKIHSYCDDGLVVLLACKLKT